MDKKTLANKLRLSLVGAIVLGASASANAALPTPVTDAFASISTMVTELETATWPIITLVVVAFALIALFKKFAGKAIN
ncbi:phage coat protein [Vibrio kagoshimensis]|uniref:major coat protein n=1 Tax=Vibrio kagoshimensis TaxID=2910244 RepID=UPI003D1EE11E